MKFLLLILIIFGTTACLPSHSSIDKAEEAEMKIYHEWLYSQKIENLKYNGEIISRPPGVEQLLFRLVIPADGGVNLKTHCIYYQVPYKKIVGLLKIVEQKNNSPCTDVSNGESWLELQNISEFKIKLESFKFVLEFKYNGLKKIWTFLLPNIANGVVHDKYQPEKEQKLFPSLTLLRITEESFYNGRNKYLGNLSDRLSTGSAIRCEQVDKNCQIVGEKLCDSCKYGWYEVVDYNCPQGGSKFCGQNHCGEKNEPACPRGKSITKGEDEGICQSDLTAVFSADHILVCQ